VSLFSLFVIVIWVPWCIVWQLCSWLERERERERVVVVVVVVVVVAASAVVWPEDVDILGIDGTARWWFVRLGPTA